MRPGVTERERRFVGAFLGVAGGNATAAALTAGLTLNRKSAAELGSRLLRKRKIQEAIASRVARREAKGIADADERDTLLSMFARDAFAEVRDRIKAIAELNKCTGRHSIKHVLEGKLTLEQVLTQSRELAK
jgi:phage terminase small subunit